MNLFGIYLPNYALWALGIAGSLVMLLVGHRLRSSLARHNRFIDACRQFRDEIISKSHLVTSGGFGQDIEARLRDYIRTTTPVVETFAAYCPSISDAWAEHRKHCENEIPKLCSPAQIIYAEGSAKRAEELFKKGVQSLLTHARHT